MPPQGMLPHGAATANQGWDGANVHTGPPGQWPPGAGASQPPPQWPVGAGAPQPPQQQQWPPDMGGGHYGPRDGPAHNDGPAHKRPVQVLPEWKSHPQHKTRMCRRIMEDGSCRFGDSCGFAHSEAELRRPGGRGGGQFNNGPGPGP
eukprot:CAMPEP_0119466390 /NCGR_PEP_ID=MMETSP1344-20130328/1075_1 /TAXON_ID=236787 /ORGANISM="Florenciella parvula, Strain CCMP2471" /LENGTH=146 /DNA_ID=CAMNT_0007498705 /DNA_START=1 /DNA_END=438 /DNA_ORIENTATION=-